MLKQSLAIVTLVFILFSTLLIAEDKDKSSKKKETGKKDGLTLDKLFPEKSFFGPSAGSMEFSFDGKRMVFLSRKEGPDPGGRDKKVKIAQYRNRFMKIKEAPRGVSDDPIKAGKETLVELFLDPTGGHGLGGDVKKLTRYRKYEEFLLRTVGSGK